MDKQDIKKMWEQGFRNQQVTINQQEINKIMKRKSGNLVERIRQTAKADQKSLPFVALLLAGVLGVMGFVSFAIFLGLLLTALYFFNAGMIRKLEGVEVKDDTFSYLTDFRNLLMYMKRYYTRLIGFGMLLLAIPLFLFFIEATGTTLQEAFAAEKRSFTLVLMLVMVLLFPAAGVFAYRLSTKVLYGTKLKRLDAMIAELGEGELR